MENNTKLCCKTCNKSFSKNFSLKRHQKLVHHDPNVEFLTKKQKVCPKCEKEVGITFHELQTHLASEHEIDIQRESMTFTSQDEFFKWKMIEEKETKSSYVQHHKAAFAKCGRVTRYYYCHRSGCYKSKGTGKRQIKQMGSNKIDSLCPAQMKLRTVNDNHVELEYIKTHIGHKCDVGRLRLTDDEKKQIADKIAKNIPLDAILNDVRNNDGTNEERIHVTSRRDLINITRQFGLKHWGTSETNDENENDENEKDENDGGNECENDDENDGEKEGENDGENVEKVSEDQEPQMTVEEVQESAGGNEETHENLTITIDQSVLEEIAKRVKTMGKENAGANTDPHFQCIYDELIAELDDCRSIEEQQFASKVLHETLVTLRAAKKRKMENQTAVISVRMP